MKETTFSPTPTQSPPRLLMHCIAIHHHLPSRAEQSGAAITITTYTFFCAKLATLASRLHLPIPTNEADTVSGVDARVRERADLRLDHHGAAVSWAEGGRLLDSKRRLRGPYVSIHVRLTIKASSSCINNWNMTSKMYRKKQTSLHRNAVLHTAVCGEGCWCNSQVLALSRSL